MVRSDLSGSAGQSARRAYGSAMASWRRRRAIQVVAAAAGLAWFAWFAWLAVAPSPPRALVGAAVSLLAVVAARPHPDPARWLRGASGEAETAALLQPLSRRGRLLGRAWVVLHDRCVPGSRANLDHVVIGPTGVWVVDTKTYRAPLTVHWRSVHVGTRLVDTSSARWEASIVAERLGLTGRAVRAVLAVHGSGLPGRGRRVGGVDVVPAVRLVPRLRRRRGSARLGRAEVARLAEECDRAFPPVRIGTAHVASLRRTASPSGGRT